MKSIVVFLVGAGLYEPTDKMGRDALEEALLIDSNQPYFTGFEPTAFELPSLRSMPRSSRIRLGTNLASERSYWLINRLNFASIREGTQEIPFIGDANYPTYSNSLLERSQGLGLPEDESFWDQIELGLRPTDWFFARASFHGGYGFKNSSGWYHPESFYFETRLNSFVLSLGRKSLFWGQADSGAIMLSDNATSFDLVEISTLAQKWPWIFSYLGDLKAAFFISRLNEDRINPHDWFSGFRLGIKPTSVFELNLSFVYQFGGDGLQDYSFKDTLVEILGGRTETGSGIHDVTNATNRSAELDMRFTFSNWKIPTSFYWENYLEDCCGSVDDVLTKSYGYAFGILQRSSSDPDAWKWRLEYVRLPDAAYWNGGMPSGWTNELGLIGNPVGRDSQRVTAKLGRYWLTIRSDITAAFFAEERLKTGKLVKSSIASVFPNFKSEKTAGIFVGSKSQLMTQLFLDLNAQYRKVWNRAYLAGHSTNEWGLLSRLELQF